MQYFISQGWPIFGALPQIWVNCKFQIWGNDPNLGQKLIFKLEIQWENNSSSSHNYSRTCPNHSRISICASLTTTIRSHRNITKKHVLDNKNFSKYGKLTQIWSNFLMMKFWPKFGAILQLLGYLHYLRKTQNFYSDCLIFSLKRIITKKQENLGKFPIEKSEAKIWYVGSI